jgi:hypothetical protein
VAGHQAAEPSLCLSSDRIHVSAGFVDKTSLSSRILRPSHKRAFEPNGGPAPPNRYWRSAH